MKRKKYKLLLRKKELKEIIKNKRNFTSKGKIKTNKS